MRDHTTSGKAGSETSHQPTPPQQDKETTSATRQDQAVKAGAPIGFDFGKMPVFPPSRQNPNLPQGLQANMESSFGQDFSGVDVHRNSQQAQHLNALAYTQGESIHFAQGEFNPHSEKGRNLIGHEFSHIVQQRSGVVQPTAVLGNGLALNDDQGLESEADRLGKKAVQGVAMEKYQSPSLGMRTGLRTVQEMSGVIQRSIKDKKNQHSQPSDVPSSESDTFGIIDQPFSSNNFQLTLPNNRVIQAQGGDCKPFSVRKVTSGPFENGLSMDDYYPDLNGKGFYSNPSSGGTFDTGARVGANVQLIGTFPSPCDPSKFTFEQTVTYTKANFNGVAHQKVGVVQDDIAKSGRNFNTSPARQDFLKDGYNMSMADPPSIDYKATPDIEFDRDFETSVKGPDGKSSVKWSTSIRVVGGKVTKNTIS
jgi:hypothetical protein